MLSSQQLLLFNLLAEYAASIAVVLFKFVCLIWHDGNTKRKKNIFLEENLSIIFKLVVEVFTEVYVIYITVSITHNSFIYHNSTVIMICFSLEDHLQALILQHTECMKQKIIIYH